MNVLVLVSSPEAAGRMQIVLDDTANRFSVASTWPEVLSRIEKDRPDLVFVESAMLLKIDLATLSKLAQPGRVPPLLLFSPSDARLPEGIKVVQHLAEGSPHFYQVEDLRIDTRRKRAGLGGRWVALPPIQYRLLVALVKRAGEVVDCRELLRLVWGYEVKESEARELIKVHIRQIRRRLGMDPEKYYYIRSVRGFGYMLASPDED